MIKDEITQITEYTKSYPGLLEVAMIYLNEFSLTNQMYDADRDILRTWLQNRLKTLE